MLSRALIAMDWILTRILSCALIHKLMFFHCLPIERGQGDLDLLDCLRVWIVIMCYTIVLVQVRSQLLTCNCHQKSFVGGRVVEDRVSNAFADRVYCGRV